MAIPTEYCNSIHLTNAVEINGAISFNDVFINGVVGTRLIHDGTRKKLKVIFNTEQTMKRAQQHTHWSLSAEQDNALFATIHEKGIVVNNLYYRSFDLLSNLWKEMTNA